MELLNKLAIEYVHLFSAIGSLATAFVAYLACRGYKPRIRAELKIEVKNYFTDDNKQLSWRFIVVKITNLNSMPVQIQENSFKIEYKKEEDREFYPIDYIDNGSSPYHPLEDIVYQYYTDEKGNHDIYNPLQKDMKEYPVLINSGESKMFHFSQEKDYLNSFVTTSLIEEAFLKMGLLFLCYRPRITLYNKFSIRIKLNKELKAKIKEVIKNKS